MADVFLGVGSNVDAERHLEFALTALTPRFRVLAVSRAYRNPAVGHSGDDYLNLVVRIDTALPPADLQDVLRNIEQTAARDRAASRCGPPTLDIDLLLYGTLVDPMLKLPRVDVLRHAFVLCPLAELAPDLRHPVSGQTMIGAWHQHRGASSAWAGSGWFLNCSLAPSVRPVVAIAKEGPHAVVEDYCAR